MGGKLNVICFDKTGTLTEDGLDVLGIRFMSQQQRSGFRLTVRIPLTDQSDYRSFYQVHYRSLLQNHTLVLRQSSRITML